MNFEEIERIKSCFDYSPETGLITNKVNRGARAKAGSLAGGVNKLDGYIQIRICGKLYRGHRIAWLLHNGCWPDHRIDHIDGDRTNNKACNLRKATNSENMQNQKAPPRHSSSGFLGVSFRSDRGVWRAVIQLDGKQINIGSFPTKEMAHKAYLSKKREIHTHCTI